MALLIVELDKRIGNAQAWRDTFREQSPDLPIRIWPDAGEVKDIEYLTFMHPDFNALPAFPNLKAMFSRAAGVDDIAKQLTRLLESKAARDELRAAGLARAREWTWKKAARRLSEIDIR